MDDRQFEANLLTQGIFLPVVYVHVGGALWVVTMVPISECITALTHWLLAEHNTISTLGNMLTHS